MLTKTGKTLAKQSETMSEERRQPEGRMSRAVGEATALADPQDEAQPNKSVKKWGGVLFSILTCLLITGMGVFYA